MTNSPVTAWSPILLPPAHVVLTDCGSHRTLGNSALSFRSGNSVDALSTTITSRVGASLLSKIARRHPRKRSVALKLTTTTETTGVTR